MDFGKKVKAETSQKIQNSLSSTALPSQNSFIVLGNAYVTNSNDSKDSKLNQDSLEDIKEMVEDLFNTIYQMQSDLKKFSIKTPKVKISEPNIPKPIIIKENSSGAVPKMVHHIERNWNDQKYPEPYFVDRLD